MKRLFLFVQVVALVLLSSPALAAPLFARIGTSSVGGGFYLIGNTIAQLGQQKLPQYNFSALTGSAAKNVAALEREDFEFSITASNAYSMAWRGVEMFKKPNRKLRFITSIFQMEYQFIVANKANIKSIPEVKGKIMDFGHLGSTFEFYVKDVFLAYDMTTADVKTVRYGKAEFEEAFSNGNIDAHLWATSVPNAQISELIRTGVATLLPIPRDKAEIIIKERPYHVLSTIKGGAYPQIPEEIPTISLVSALVCHENVSEEMVYQVTKMLHENSEFLKERQPSYFSGFTLDGALDGKAELPLHPGAERYYREKGLIK